MIRLVKPEPGNNVDILKVKEGNRPILFAVHGSGGVLSYAKLARYLDRDQPTYVVKGRGLDDPDHPFRDIHDLAGQYVSAMLKIQTDGPFLICGRFSYILFEVGQQLLSRNIPVSMTMVFDMAPPVESQYFYGKDLKSVLRFVYHRYRRMWKNMRKRAISVAAPPTGEQFETEALTGIESHEDKGSQNYSRKINDGLHTNYQPKHYDAKVVYIQCMEFSRIPRKSKHILAWKALADEVDVHVTPGTHGGMFDMPHVQVLARIVQAECNKATTNRPSL